MLKLISFYSFFRSSYPYRRVYGFCAGLRMALQVRKANYVADAGTLVAIDVPGLQSPIMLRARTMDAAVFQQIFGDRELDFHLDTTPRFIVDAGAHIGLSSLWLSLRFPDALIVSLEMESGNFSLLKLNTKGRSQITALHNALWWERAILNVEDPDLDTWGFRVSNQHAANGKTIESLTVSDLLNDFSRPSVDLLKMDIEGAELEMFSHEYEAWIDRVSVIAVETHERFRPGCRMAIRTAVEGRGFTERECGEYTILTHSS